MHLRRNNFGIDDNAIEERLAFLGFSSDDHALATRMQDELIRPSVDTIIERFYATLLQQPESQSWLHNADTVASLKRTQRDYLLSLGLGFDTPDYFEERLHVGVIHAAIGLPLCTYLSAVSVLTQAIISVLPPADPRHQDTSLALVGFIGKIMSLDMILATQAYHLTCTDDLKSEISQARSREKTFKALAETDSLTGLHNRKHVFGLLEDAVDDARQRSTDFCVLMVDIDRFKHINDNYGHPAGDAVLQQVADILGNALRSQDIAGRYGGEEFILGLVGIPPDAALEAAQRIRRTLEESPLTVGDQSIRITASIGLCCLTTGDSLEQIISRADTALYHAKNSGRNRVVEERELRSA